MNVMNAIKKAMDPKFMEDTAPEVAEALNQAKQEIERLRTKTSNQRRMLRRHQQLRDEYLKGYRFDPYGVKDPNSSKYNQRIREENRTLKALNLAYNEGNKVLRARLQEYVKVEDGVPT